MDKTHAHEFAARWIADWNAHDAAAIVAHYSENVVYRSPFVARLSGEASGEIRGRKALQDYVERGLAAYPDLRFELLGVFVGVNSVVLHYRSVNDLLAAETFFFDANGAVIQVAAHYSS